MIVSVIEVESGGSAALPFAGSVCRFFRVLARGRASSTDVLSDARIPRLSTPHPGGLNLVAHAQVPRRTWLVTVCYRAEKGRAA